MSEEFSSEEQDRNDEPDNNAAFFSQKLQSSYQNPTQNQMPLFPNMFGTFGGNEIFDTALAGTVNLPIASQENNYSVTVKIGNYPVVTGNVEPDVIRPMTGWEAFKWDLGKVVPYIPYVNVLNDAKIALTGSDFAGYYASPGEQQDAKFQTVFNVATVGISGLLGAELKSLRGATEEIGVVSKGLSNAAKIIDGINVVEGKVGGKIPVEEFATIRNQSIHNAEAKSITLGKYTPTVENGVENWAKAGPDSYIAKAGDKSTYFDLGSEWSSIQKRYNLANDEMFKYFNKPALDDAVRSGKTIQFSHKPDLEIYKGTYLAEEWNYLKSEHGYSILMEGEGGIWYAK